MRVDRLRLSDFKNLRDFEVDFDVTSSRQVVVGRNGVGKSNLLEALAWIFGELDLEQDATFEYEIEYHCNNHFVRIVSVRSPPGDGQAPRYSRQYQVAMSENIEDATSSGQRPYQDVRQAEFYRRNRPVNGETNPARLLPLYVFGYYSGTSGRFNSAFATHEARYYREQITGSEAPLRSLFLARPHHSQFALLSFFAANDETAKRFLKDEFRITGLGSVLFAFREPYWSKGKSRKSDRGDGRFWGAGGKVATFLDALFRHSLAPMAGQLKRQVSLGQDKTFDMRYCFVPNEQSLRAISSDLEPKEFFARLESTIFSDLVGADGRDVRIAIEIDGQKHPITFKELSEGEQLLLTIIGLMRFTAQNESLFLLDEPDTHLNLAWCLDYLQNLRDYGVEPTDSQIPMTTHSPLTFAGLSENEVVVLQRRADGYVSSQHPVAAPRGMGFQAILTSEFFGMRSAIDRETLAKIDLKRELALKEDKSQQDQKRLLELDEELGRLDFSKAARDPLYLEFIRAMTAAQNENPNLAQPAPETANWEVRQEIARDIAKRLLEENNEARGS